MKKDILAGILALAIADVASDIFFLSSVLFPKQGEDNDKHPLIGRRYIVTDNSYAIDKETGISVYGLHGKEYIIVSDPYVEEVEPIFSNEERFKKIFVDVFSIDSARKYRVLFQERNVVKED